MANCVAHTTVVWPDAVIGEGTAVWCLAQIGEGARKGAECVVDNGRVC